MMPRARALPAVTVVPPHCATYRLVTDKLDAYGALSQKPRDQTEPAVSLPLILTLLI